MQFDRKSNISIQEDAIQNIFRKMVAILSKGRWVKSMVAGEQGTQGARPSVAMVLT